MYLSLICLYIRTSYDVHSQNGLRRCPLLCSTKSPHTSKHCSSRKWKKFSFVLAHLCQVHRTEQLTQNRYSLPKLKNPLQKKKNHGKSVYLQFNERLRRQGELFKKCDFLKEEEENLNEEVWMNTFVQTGFSFVFWRIQLILYAETASMQIKGYQSSCLGNDIYRNFGTFHGKGAI